MYSYSAEKYQVCEYEDTSQPSRSKKASPKTEKKAEFVFGQERASTRDFVAAGGEPRVDRAVPVGAGFRGDGRRMS